jgi:MerR family transcriptional regulator, light-induced transcriptional regulator
MNAFTIKDLENLSGVKAHTIRIWEQRYNFLKPLRTDTNIRFYNNDELKTILNIALLNKSGYKISHINNMTDSEICEKIAQLNYPEGQQERIINKLVGYMIDFDTDSFEQMLNDELRLKDVDIFINEVIFPFLEKVGILWTTNHINPAQEHLVTNIIRQKILVGIENISPVLYLDKTALLFLPEGEHHEVGLLYVFYLLKKKGVKVFYLGADVPLKDLTYVVKAKSPHFIYTHLTSLAHNFNMERFLNNVKVHIQGSPVYISGPVTLTYKKNVPETIHFKKSLDEVKQFIAAL